MNDTTEADTTEVLHVLADNELEFQVLGGIFCDPSMAERLTTELDAEDFYNRNHRHIFNCMQKLYQNGEPIDYIGLKDELDIAGHLSEVGGPGIIARLASVDFGMVVHADHHARRLRVHRRLRDRERFAQLVIRQVYSDRDPLEIDAAIEEWLMKNATPTTNDSWLYGWESIDWHNQRLDRTRKQLEDGEVRQLDWPWSSWNRRIRPAAPGQLSILTAADGQGKSTYLESIAEHWTQQGAHVCLAHLEDDHGYKLNRRLARHSKIPLGTIEDGIPDQLDRGRRDSANSQMASWAERLHYYHAPGQTMRQICRELESRHKQGLCDAVVLDYLDKCVADRRQVRLYGDNIWERQADDMETLKSFAERLGLPVFTATQGNKSMQRQGTITRSSIQGSGQKSHKSQLVLILTRELLESDQHTNGGDLIGKKGDYSPIVNVRIDKQNRGMTGEFQQYLRGECFLVVDLEATT